MAEYGTGQVRLMRVAHSNCRHPARSSLAAGCAALLLPFHWISCDGLSPFVQGPRQH
jgi:hypothetical protein